jgi:glucose-6-phosphate dehydrogenase assembly protein OpcA
MPIETQSNAVRFSLAQGVDIDKIEKQLATMWSSSSTSTAEEGSNSGVTRACALNLIVYTTPEDDRDKLEDLLTRVNEQHPGRTLILVSDRAAPEAGLDAYISMRCRQVGSTGKQICGEQVTIEARGSLVETAATAVAPLLVPDVPVYLWWKDIPHYEDRLFDRMAQMADRIVIDSCAFDKPYDDLLRLTQMIHDESRHLLASDLNWGRLTTWRTLLASFWDVPAYRPLLDKINRITIEYRPAQHTMDTVVPAALLLAGWLAGRLQLEVVSNGVRVNEGTIECELSSGDRRVLLVLAKSQAAESEDRMIAAVTVAVDQEGAEFSVALRAEGAKLETEAKIGAEHSVGRLLGYERRSDAERLSRELSFLSRDVTYEEAMARAGQLIEAIRGQN